MAALSVVFLVLQWEPINRIPSTVAALAGLTAVGVAVRAALPGAVCGIQASRTGKATSVVVTG
ncbi:hypothetical protein [Nonomuraea sp. NPDC005650]|uniref:hypothetical protein n=1 Tax=Nonomuraea sp. NPDC005650 TaxID=3157045 RepID=UPI0033B34ED6